MAGDGGVDERRRRRRRTGWCQCWSVLVSVGIVVHLSCIIVHCCSLLFPAVVAVSIVDLTCSLVTPYIRVQPRMYNRNSPFKERTTISNNKISRTALELARLATMPVIALQPRMEMRLTLVVIVKYLLLNRSFSLLDNTYNSSVYLQWWWWWWWVSRDQYTFIHSRTQSYTVVHNKKTPPPPLFNSYVSGSSSSKS